MGAFRVLLGSLHYLGLYVQLSVSTRQAGHREMENHVSGNAMFTEVPHDMTAQRGQDVEMACSFRGAGTPSYSLEIQWWYIRNHLDWTDRQPWTTNEVAPEEETPKDATKISVVKVVGSNISHKLRLSRVKPTDEGTYECRVIDFSDDAGARHHRVRAYLQVVPESHALDARHGGGGNNFDAADDTKREFVDGESHGGTREHDHHQNHEHHPEQGKRPSSAVHHGHSSQQHKAGRELRQRDMDSNHSHNDCSNEPSCAL
ncbi:V-set and transmembrane domain-containing protein 2-like protein [Austrofundulus limnaeus]|uniref:V-set and transmembrane domain-containing protein 2-like protein n=1 Tax=Austrofundulus limnaeus TaxID=52670 RepID=A0A2I4BSY9_AUSLI|nr:PREDICTED: V-set and transmembrane domain-containing protein 2-like protein [Austrofundulus limnaeus]